MADFIEAGSLIDTGQPIGDGALTVPLLGERPPAVVIGTRAAPNCRSSRVATKAAGHKVGPNRRACCSAAGSVAKIVTGHDQTAAAVVQAASWNSPAMTAGREPSPARQGGAKLVGRRTYLKVQGRWVYLYRALDRSGALVDVMLSETRDMAAVKAFFRSAKAVTGITPARVTTDGHDSYPRAIRTELGRHVRHRTSRYLNNRLEQGHRGIKGRYRPMRGFKSVRSATRFCRSHDERCNFLRPRLHHHQPVSANHR